MLRVTKHFTVTETLTFCFQNLNFLHPTLCASIQCSSNVVLILCLSANLTFLLFLSTPCGFTLSLNEVTFCVFETCACKLIVCCMRKKTEVRHSSKLMKTWKNSAKGLKIETPGCHKGCCCFVSKLQIVQCLACSSDAFHFCLDDFDLDPWRHASMHVKL